MMQYILAFLAMVLPGLVQKVLVALGVGAISYVGIDFVLDQARSYLFSNLSGMPLDIQQLLGLFKFDIAINIMLSAVTTRLTISGMSKAGSVTKLGSVPK